VPTSRRRFGVTDGRTGDRVVALLALGLVLVGGCAAGDVKAQPTARQGADPVVWVGAFCGGLSDVIAGVSAVAKSQPSPQGQKDGLIEFADIAQRAFADTAQKLTQLGPPRIADGKRVQDTTVGFFTTAAETVGAQRANLTALDVKDPDFLQKASHLAGPDLSAASTQMQGLTSNNELAPAFGAAPECQRLSSSAGH
jgi:hypothetical protein